MKLVKGYEVKASKLFRKAENYSRNYGLEHPKTVKAWARYDNEITKREK